MTQRSHTPRATFVDDGELQDVRRLLDALAVEYTDARNHDEFAASDGCDLLISSARRALATPFRGDEAPALPCRLHVVVYDAISEGLRRILSRSGCDVAVGRPVHTAVLRLLVEHAGYGGPERRGRSRVAMSIPVRLQRATGELSATIVQLSDRGCGLVSANAASIAERVEIVLPPEFSAESPAGISARVVEVTPTDRAGAHGLSLVFDAINARTAALLERVMAEHSLGVTPTYELAGAANPTAAGGEPDDSPPPMRSGPRKLFAGRVVAAGSGKPRVMIGRDLSIGGMRVRSLPGLGVGDRLKVALYGGSDSPAIVLEAEVVRDDGWDGLALRFLNVPRAERSRLEALIASLPATRSPQVGEANVPGVLVSEILESG